MAPISSVPEVAGEKRKTRLMEKRSRAGRAALRAKKRERSMLRTERDGCLGRFLNGEIVAAAFLELEEDGEMNLDDQNAMMKAIAACLKNFATGHGNDGAGSSAGV